MRSFSFDVGRNFFIDFRSGALPIKERFHTR
jgi:hypothetical protein